jgi:hypothetical protein
MATKKQNENKNETAAVNPVSILEQLKKTSGRKGGSRIKNRTYKITAISAEEIVEKNISLSPQAIICVGIILEQMIANGPEITEAKLFDALEDGVEQFGTTKQTPWKIFQYYRKPIMEAGFIREVVNASASTEEKDSVEPAAE